MESLKRIFKTDFRKGSKAEKNCNQLCHSDRLLHSSKLRFVNVFAFNDQFCFLTAQLLSTQLAKRMMSKRQGTAIEKKKTKKNYRS